ncbi:hypothetical protein ACQPZP_33745 [Spirillospora sp. CA-142024]|uniref:hypothetical protein n=1 Tax=Spirillospora sp. CA-142024 TaxID=3240036 RepID=UPI003D9123DE
MSLRRVPTVLAAAAMLTGGLVATAPAASATSFSISSANGCTQARFSYTYGNRTLVAGKYGYTITYSGTVYDSPSCYSDGYGGVIQIRYQHSGGFVWETVGWSELRRNEDNGSAGFSAVDDAWYDDVHFRVCNRNPRTGTVGTCGTPTGS